MPKLFDGRSKIVLDTLGKGTYIHIQKTARHTQGNEQMTTVYTNQARKNAKGEVFAPGKDEKTGRYFIFKLCENYDGKVRGGIRKSWCLVSATPTNRAGTAKEAVAQFNQLQKGLTLDEAKALFEKNVGQKLY